MFEAVVLMGGYGTRLREISNGIPKSMMPVRGQPFVYILLKKLELSGCRRIILSLHYKAEWIIRQISRDKPVDCDLIFVIEETPLGTGGALKHAANSIQAKSFLAINGDTFTTIDYSIFYNEMYKNEFAIAGVNVDDAHRYGALTFNNNNKLINIIEKGESRPAIINSGTYLISKSVITNMDRVCFSLEKDFIPRFFGKADIYLHHGEFIDIGIPEDYFLACEYFK